MGKVVKGIRPDFVDFGTNTIFKKNYGDTWKTVLDLY